MLVSPVNKVPSHRAPPSLSGSVSSTSTAQPSVLFLGVSLHSWITFNSVFMLKPGTVHPVGQLDHQAQAPKGVFMEAAAIDIYSHVFHCPLGQKPCYCCQGCPQCCFSAVLVCLAAAFKQRSSLAQARGGLSGDPPSTGLFRAGLCLG